MDVLEYRVPDRQDPGVVRAALTREGYDAPHHQKEGHKYLRIECPGGRDEERERVRETIARAHLLSLEGPEFVPEVQFDDEG